MSDESNDVHESEDSRAAHENPEGSRDVEYTVAYTDDEEEEDDDEDGDESDGDGE